MQTIRTSDAKMYSRHSFPLLQAILFKQLYHGLSPKGNIVSKSNRTTEMDVTSYNQNLCVLYFRATCVYLSCKTEEFNVSITQFVSNVKGDKLKAMDIILSNELLLMQQLNYYLTVHNPFRPIEGFLIDIKTRCSLANPERLRAGIDDFIDKTFLTDACLLYAPSQVSCLVLNEKKNYCFLHIRELTIDHSGQLTIVAVDLFHNVEPEQSVFVVVI